MFKGRFVLVISMVLGMQALVASDQSGPFDKKLVDRAFSQSMLLGMRRKQLQDRLKLAKNDLKIARLQAQRVQEKLSALEEDAVYAYWAKQQMAELQQIVDQAEQQFKRPGTSRLEKVHCLKRIQIALQAADRTFLQPMVRTNLLVPDRDEECD